MDVEQRSRTNCDFGEKLRCGVNRFVEVGWTASAKVRSDRERWLTLAFGAEQSSRDVQKITEQSSREEKSEAE